MQRGGGGVISPRGGGASSPNHSLSTANFSTNFISDLSADSHTHSYSCASWDPSYSAQSSIPTIQKLYLKLYSVTIQGKGAVMRQAFSLIDSDIYIMIDADTQYDTSCLPRAIAHFMQHSLDMLNIARIPITKDTHRKYHSFGNKFLTLIVSLLFGKKFDDMLSGYRIFSKAFVKSFPAHSQGFEIESELTIFALQQKMRIDEIGAEYKARPHNSFSKLSTFRDGFKILFMIMQLTCTERPLLIFGILSFLCFIFGVTLGMPILIEYMQTSQVAKFPTLFVCVGLGIVSIIFALFGFLAHLVVKNTKEQRHFTYLLYREEV